MQQPMQEPVQPQQIKVVIQEPIVKQPVQKPVEKKQPVQKPVEKQPVKKQPVKKQPVHLELERVPMQLQCPHCKQWVSLVIMNHY